MKKMLQKSFLIILVLSLVFSLCACNIDEIIDGVGDVIGDELDNMINDALGDGTGGSNTEAPGSGSVSAFDISIVPAYTEYPYYVINNNVPFFTEDEIVSEEYEYYGDLDSLGRCTLTVACISRELMPTEERKGLDTKPTGWINKQYDIVSGGYLYNRCHLIGFQLTGENDNEKNLITGTRYMNWDGMVEFENMTADYIKETGNHVMYRSTPIFEGDNLLASGVLLEAYSVEDNGEGICFNVFIYNVQPGIVLDYATGDSRLADGADNDTAGNVGGNENNGSTDEPGGDETLGGDEITGGDETGDPDSGETVDGFSLSLVPAYTDSPFYVINGNVPFFTESEIVTESYEFYGELDYLGRCTVTMACLGADLMPTEERGDISSVTPTGWINKKYDIVSGGYLYNRCHLIGFQLTGENANEKNLITGTRYMNWDGMVDFENMTADYIKETGNHVMYRATPIFDSENLLASGVLLEAYSVEDNGEGICFNVFIYNVQPGVILDYATGQSELAEQSETENEETNDTDATYILNTNTMKVHLPTCRHAENIADSNREESDKTEEELTKEGYVGCLVCDPFG